MRRSLPILAALLAMGCDIYDIGPALAALDASQQSGLEVADRCAEDISPVVSQSGAHTLSLDGLTDTVRTLSGCDGTGVVGPDGFLRLSASADQRWAIVVEPLEPTTDVVLYLMPTCDPAGCTELLDRCGAGIPETLIFQPELAGDYFVGIDSRGGGGTVEISAISPRCGDRRRELGEGCDDGNDIDGDGCDRECRLEISPERPREIEPNNGWTEANVITGGSVVGRLGGACDIDFFAVRITERASLRATLLDGAALPCQPGTPEISMALLNDGSLARRGVGERGGSAGSCPSIEADAAFAQDLEPGVYFLSLAAERGTPTLDYNLVLEVVPTS